MTKDDILKEKQQLFKDFSKEIKPFLEKYLHDIAKDPGVNVENGRLCKQYIADISQFSKEYEESVDKLGTTIFEER